MIDSQRISRIKKTQFDGLKTIGRISPYTSIDDVQRDAVSDHHRLIFGICFRGEHHSRQWPWP